MRAVHSAKKHFRQCTVLKIFHCLVVYGEHFEIWAKQVRVLWGFCHVKHQNVADRLRILGRVAKDLEDTEERRALEGVDKFRLSHLDHKELQGFKATCGILKEENKMFGAPEVITGNRYAAQSRGSKEFEQSPQELECGIFEFMANMDFGPSDITKRTICKVTGSRKYLAAVPDCELAV
ncbi:hypothetical protein CPB84DRAFT_1963162 [Gymnopilus junonius]|uniref:Uncharacterized protein n=1 Tax=Gymnopilus junonius TaxID=109634 RepID=A0A9P5NMG2_GYMJU|nr:hypothetical protein CPB84DRAFT_1963162 [Gymnopilus junonius]